MMLDADRGGGESLERLPSTQEGGSAGPFQRQAAPQGPGFSAAWPRDRAGRLGDEVGYTPLEEGVEPMGEKHRILIFR